jgi:hypothetical protein
LILRARTNDVMPNVPIRTMKMTERTRWGNPFGSLKLRTAEGTGTIASTRKQKPIT